MGDTFKEEATAFEEKWLHKVVRPKGLYYQIPIKKYQVTAALYKYEDDDITIFAVMAEDWSPGPKGNAHWFTIKIGSEELNERMNDFEILESIGDNTA